MYLENKAVIVTGAAQGIGEAAAVRLAEAGAAVSCVDIDVEGAERTCARITGSGGRAVAIGGDVASREANEACVDRTVQEFGGLDALVLNAAVQLLAGIEATSERAWERLWATNVVGTSLGVAAALPHLRARGGGSIVITSSLLGIVGDPALPAYGATKGALRSLCRSLAAAHGPENIRVNTVCPGDVDTKLVQEFFDGQEDPRQARERIAGHYPLRRIARPRDIANVMAFLVSDDANYITGTDLVVDGGLLARAY